MVHTDVKKAVKNREKGIMNIKITETQLIDKQREFILLD